MTVTTHRSFCRFCHANCAMLVDVADGRVAAVRGDPDDALFGGYTCIKGRQLAEVHNSPERLRACLVRDPSGGFAKVSTAAALDRVADRLRAIIDEHGPHAVAVYCGTYAFQNSAGVDGAMAFAHGIGTRNFYTSVTLDQPAKVYTTARYGIWQGGQHSFDTADVCFMIGNNPIVSHYAPPCSVPTFSPSRRLQDAKARGLKLIVADPRTSEVAKLADIHLPVMPGEDAAMLAGMLNVILSEGLHDRNFCGAHVDGMAELAAAVAPFTPAVAAARAGVDADALVAAARMFATASRGIASTGTGPEMAGNGTLTVWLVTAMNIVCNRFCQEGELSSIPRVFTAVSPRRAQVGRMALFGEGFPASRIRGMTHLGREMPCNVLADEMLTPGEGQVRALISIGGNPAVAFPDTDKFARALDGLDLLVSIDVVLAATARRSDVVLAPAMSLERSDITNLSEWFYDVPYARFTPALVDPPGDLIDEYAMLWGLAHRLGTPIPLAGGPCPMDAMPDKAAFLDLMTAGCAVRPTTVRDDTAHDGRAIIYSDLHPRVAAPDPASATRFDLTVGDMPADLARYHAADPHRDGFPLRLVSRRTRHRMNSVGGHLAALRAKAMGNPAHINPADLADLGLADGALVTIESPAGRMQGVVKASAAMRRGVVSMAHSFGRPDGGDVRVDGDTTGRLVSDSVDVDPITGQALQSAIPVRLVAA